jgi:hypothetical protein
LPADQSWHRHTAEPVERFCDKLCSVSCAAFSVIKVPAVVCGGEVKALINLLRPTNLFTILNLPLILPRFMAYTLPGASAIQSRLGGDNRQ